MRMRAEAASVIVTLLLATPAGAISMTNRDDRDHKVTIVEGSARPDHTLAPQGVLEGVCLTGCVIRLNDSENDEYDLEGNEIVSIEEGYLYYDGPEAGAEPAKPDAPKQ